MKFYNYIFSAVSTFLFIGAPACATITDAEMEVLTPMYVCEEINCSLVPSSGSVSVTKMGNTSCLTSTERCYRTKYTNNPVVTGEPTVSGYVVVTDCTSCPNSASVTLKNGQQVPTCVAYQDYDVHYQQVCVTCECDTELEYSSWALVDGTNYQRRKKTTCSPANGCLLLSTYEYQCNSGYYGAKTTNELLSPNPIVPTCTQCPGHTDSPNTVGTSGYLGISDGFHGAETIVDCYQRINSQFSDSNGTYRFTSSCKYTE